MNSIDNTQGSKPQSMPQPASGNNNGGEPPKGTTATAVADDPNNDSYHIAHLFDNMLSPDSIDSGKLDNDPNHTQQLPVDSSTQVKLPASNNGGDNLPPLPPLDNPTRSTNNGNTSPPINQNAPQSNTGRAESALSIATKIISGLVFGSTVILQVLKYNFVLPAAVLTATNVLTAISVGLALLLAAAYFLYRPQSSPNIGKQA